MATATLTSKGQTTIPKEIRERLGLKPGDRLDFVVEPDGRVTLAPVNADVAELRGMLPRPARPASLEDMDRGIRDGAAARDARSRKR
ncbi:MAG TPA: AbrB/MazE/SpoVT family DNA-binding domain-containing protein [Gemmatimonadales bacterium]|nr:AbrB/MazE/SpoVT family DNA-binding domain-containing protein [Gemmatimonadales bacterium]